MNKAIILNKVHSKNTHTSETENVLLIRVMNTNIIKLLKAVIVIMIFCFVLKIKVRIKNKKIVVNIPVCIS